MSYAANLPLEFLKLLAHDVRWQLLAALAESDRRVQELVERLQRPQNLVSYHLRLLREGRWSRERRSSADGRDVYYSLDLEQLRHAVPGKRADASSGPGLRVNGFGGGE
jgi:ArsR family transcriptional regulator, arsenate/arsenite/antimonite-responsive transcriptional repressor / arsenate reductase (thioredoxin)